jgi:hypothetical protein
VAVAAEQELREEIVHRVVREVRVELVLMFPMDLLVQQHLVMEHLVQFLIQDILQVVVVQAEKQAQEEQRLTVVVEQQEKQVRLEDVTQQLIQVEVRVRQEKAPIVVHQVPLHN